MPLFSKSYQKKWRSMLGSPGLYFKNRGLEMWSVCVSLCVYIWNGWSHSFTNDVLGAG